MTGYRDTVCEDCGAPALAGGRWCGPCFRGHAHQLPDRTQPTWSAAHACRIAGITYRQCDYLARTGTIEPTIDASGSGTRRGYTLDDIIWLTVHGALTRTGLSSLPLLRRLRDSGGVLDQDGVTLTVDLRGIGRRVKSALGEVPSQTPELLEAGRGPHA